MRLSSDRPAPRVRYPMPPPKVSPAMPVVEMIPPVVARPNAWVAWLTSPHVAPPSARAVFVAGSTRIPRMRPRSTTSASSAAPKPGTLWPPPRMATAKPAARAALTAAMTSATPVQRTTTAGRLSIIALYTLRASSYRPSSGRMTSPRTDPFSSVATFSFIIRTLPFVGTARYRRDFFNAFPVDAANLSVIRPGDLSPREPMTSDSFDAFKATQRQVWKSFAPLAQATTPSAARLVHFAGVRPGQKVLDVGCGTGVVAITARRAGGAVTGVDLTPELVAIAKDNATIAGLDDIVWKEGDVESLPFADGAFDMVLSQFAHIFAPRPGIAVKEMLRVLKRGGVLAFHTWPPELLFGRVFALISRYMPPAPDPKPAPPGQWGDPTIVLQRLGTAVRDVTFDRGSQLTHALSPRHYRPQRGHPPWALDDRVHPPTRYFGRRPRTQVGGPRGRPEPRGRGPCRPGTGRGHLDRGLRRPGSDDRHERCHACRTRRDARGRGPAPCDRERLGARRATTLDSDQSRSLASA